MKSESNASKQGISNVELVELSENQRKISLTKRHIQHDEFVNVGGLIYEVSSLEKEKSKIKKERAELHKTLKGFDLLVEEGIINPQIQLQEHCLRNPNNGNILFAIQPQDGTKFFKKNQSYFFRFYGNLINTNMHETYKTTPTIDIRFSPCLFGIEAAYLVTETNKIIPITDRCTETEEKVKSMNISNDGFSFYEKEILTRLLGSLSFLAQNKKKFNITSTLPRGAYYTFLFNAYQKGFVSKEMVLEWFDCVDKKVNTITKRIQSYIRKHIPNCIQFSNYGFLDSACDLMRDYVTNNTSFDSNQLLALIHQTLIEKDEFAKFAFSKIPFPENFRDLADVSYVLSVLDDMSDTVDYEKRKLNILLYDITESKFLDKVRQMRNIKFLNPMNLYRIDRRSNVEILDHLSYIGMMTTEHIIYNLSDEFVSEEMHGLKKLYAFKEEFLPKELQTEILRNLSDTF